MRVGRPCFLVSTTLLAALHGCIAPPGKPQGESPVTASGERDGAPAPAPEQHFRATVEDRFNTTFVVTDVTLHVPRPSFLGGESGEATRRLPLAHGAAELGVALEDLESIVIKGKRGGRLDAVVTLREHGSDAQPLEGTLQPSLELRGRFERTGLRVSVVLRDVTRVTIEAMLAEKKMRPAEK